MSRSTENKEEADEERTGIMKSLYRSETVVMGVGFQLGTTGAPGVTPRGLWIFINSSKLSYTFPPGALFY